MMGKTLNASLILKWVQSSYPYFSLSLVFFLSALFFGYSLKILEGPLYYIDASLREERIDFRYLDNCIWTIMVSMTTVGYGDYYPQTNLGRAVTVASTLVGNALIGLFVFSLDRSFNMNSYEQAAYDFSQRLNFKQKLEKQSVNLFFNNFRFENAKNSYFIAKKQKQKFTLRKAKKDRMLSTLLDKISSKKEFRQNFKFFRNNFNQYSTADLIKLKITDLDKSLEQILKRVDRLEQENIKLRGQLAIKDQENSRERDSLPSVNETKLDEPNLLTESVCHSELREFIDQQW